MTNKQSHTWINVLHELTTSYNHTFHRSIKRTPASVSRHNQTEVWNTQYNTLKKAPKHTISIPSRNYRFKLGDTVRLSHLRRAFQREYEERWTTEYFIVTDRGIKETIPYYKVKDIQGDIIDGTFYGNELTKIGVDKDTTFRIEKILKKSGNRALIKWLGWSKKFNSFIPLKDVERYKGT